MLPVIVFMIFGIIETGFIVRDLVSVRSGSEEGARMAAIAANTPTADFKILNAVKAHLGIPKSNIVLAFRPPEVRKHTDFAVA